MTILTAYLRWAQDAFRETPTEATGAAIPAALAGVPADTPVMMYCTGGIRCDIYSTHLRKQGFTCADCLAQHAYLYTASLPALWHVRPATAAISTACEASRAVDTALSSLRQAYLRPETVTPIQLCQPTCSHVSCLGLDYKHL